MIPLNKHYKCDDNRVNLTEVISKIFPDRNITLTFSARQALNLAYKEIFRQNGSSKIAVSPLTCFEALYPIINNKHEPVFIDVNEYSFLMDTTKLPINTKFIQAIHLGGFPQSLDFIRPDITLIEDCAQAFGARIYDREVGSFGEYSGFSFMKNLNALGGGFLLTKNPVEFNYTFSNPKNSTILYRQMKSFLESRISYNNPLLNILYLLLLKLKPSNSSIKIHEIELSDKIITSIENRLACRQELLTKRKDIAYKLLAEINTNRFIPQQPTFNSEPMPTRLYFSSKHTPSKRLIHKLRSKGIAANNLSQSYLNPYQESVFESPYFKKYAKYSSLEVYKEIHDKLFCIPLSPALNEKEILHISRNLNKA